MLWIKKSPATPAALRALQGRPASSYSDLGDEDGLELRAKLCEDQGYLCAYCMSRVDERAATGDRHLEREGRCEEHPRRLSGSSIEHLIPQSEDASADLLWHNMVAVCSGRRVWDDGLHCDKSRGAVALPQLNPLRAHVRGLLVWQTRTQQTPPMRRGSAPRRVTVVVAEPAPSLEDAIRTEVAGDIETLGLNVPWLGRNRHEALEELRQVLARELGDGPVPRSWIEAQRRKLTTPDERGRLPEYVGVLLWQLERWERKAR